jgi:hypothetical protein
VLGRFFLVIARNEDKGECTTCKEKIFLPMHLRYAGKPTSMKLE